MERTVLCIFTYRRVFMLDVNRIPRCDDEGDDHPSPPVSPPPPSMRVLDFLENGLPLGMGLLKLNNALYMFGGEYFDPQNDLMDLLWIREDDIVDPLDNFGFHSVVHGVGLQDHDPPKAVYAMDLGNPLSKPVKIGSLLGPKLYAIVEEIGGLVYVLSTLNVSKSMPLFEVWDPSTQTSRALPNPPSFSECRTVAHHCIVAGTILCRMGNFDLNRFHIDSERWERVDDSPPQERLGMKGRFDVRIGDVFVSRRVKDLRVWAEVVDGDSRELMLDPSKTQPEVNGFFPIGYFSLADTSQQGEYMCGLVPYQSDLVYGFALYVFLFQMEKRESKLSVRYLRRQFYDFTYIRCRGEEVPLFGMDKAVVGRVSPHTFCNENEDYQEKKQREREEAVVKQAKREKMTM